MTNSRKSSNVCDSNGGDIVTAGGGQNHPQRLPAISEFEEINEELKKENMQLRAQLLEQDEIMTREFRRRMEDSGVRIRSRIARAAPPAECFQKHTIALSPEPSSKHEEEKNENYQSHFEEAQEDLCKVLTQAATLKQKHEEAQNNVLKLEKVMETYKYEIKGLQHELCTALDLAESSEIKLQVERRKTDDLTSLLNETEDKAKSEVEAGEVELQAARKKHDSLTLQILSLNEEVSRVSEKSSAKTTQIKKLKEELVEANSRIESSREELVKKIELIVQLEEQIEHANSQFNDSEVVRKIEEENAKLRQELECLQNVLSRPEHTASSAMVELELELARSHQEASELRRRNIVLLNRERDQMRLLKEVEHEKKILMDDLDSEKKQSYYETASTWTSLSRNTPDISSILDSLTDADTFLSGEFVDQSSASGVTDISISTTSIAKRQAYSETSTNDTNSMTSSIPNDRDSSSILESSIHFETFSVDDNMDQSNASEATDISQDTMSTSTSCMQRNHNYTIFDESDDSCSSIDDEKSDEFDESACNDVGSNTASAELLHLPALEDENREEKAVISKNSTVSLGVWLANSMSKLNHRRVDPKSSTSIATKSTFTGSSKDDSFLDVPTKPEQTTLMPQVPLNYSSSRSFA